LITGELKNKIDNIRQTIWNSGVSNPMTVVEQITYLMFIHSLDANENMIEQMEALDHKQRQHIFPASLIGQSILFLGGAPYANIMAPELKEYAEKLDPSKVGKVILFTTSNWSRRTVLALKKMLRGRSITVDDDYFYAHMLHIKGRVDAAKEFGKKE